METIHVADDAPDMEPLQQNSEESDEQMVNSNIETEIEKKKIKHSSALAAAAVCRSAVQHAHLHTISNRPGDFAHTATNISYDV